MVNVAELLELRFGNPTKPPFSESQGMGVPDLIDEVRVPVQVQNEVEGDEREDKVEEVPNSNVVEGLDGLNVDTSVEGGIVTVEEEEERVSEDVEGFKQSGNEINGINLVVDLSGVSEEIGGCEQTGNEINGINLVVDLSPSGGLDGKSSYGDGGNKVFPGSSDVPDSNGFGDNSGQNVLVSEEGKCREEHMWKEYMTEIEGNYDVTDLVWGKVRSHPWWPGQIFDPNDASQKAKKHFKKDGFLIAYFGDQTYAWNNASQIKPFRKHFSQMVKQSNTEAFRHAVDCALSEVSRRFEFGLACSCLSEDMFMKIKSQIVVNAGISEESSRREGGDRSYSVASFEPAKLVENVKALAVDPFGETDRLEFVKTRAQLSAYHRWKGCYQLPTQTSLNGLVENADSEPDSGKENASEEAIVAYESDDEVKSGKGKSTTRDSYSRKRKHISTDGVSSSKKTKLLSEMMSDGCLSIQNNKSVKAGRKRKVVDSLYDDLRDESGTADKKSTSSLKKPHRVGENIHRIVRKLARSALSVKNDDRSSQNPVSISNAKPPRVHHAIPPSDSKESRGAEVPAAYPPSDEILLQLYLVAIDPMKENSSMNSLVSFFSDFRRYYVETPINEVTGLDGIEDSYWTDRIIQSNPEDQALFEPEVATPSPNPENKQGSLESNAEKPCEEYSGTALILNFDKKVSVPSVTNLTDIYTQVGPLKEITTMNKRAKLVFERQCDAETAFSSAGKYSLFGPSLLNYSLDYHPTPRKITTRARNKIEEKDATSGRANQVQELED